MDCIRCISKQKVRRRMRVGWKCNIRNCTTAGSSHGEGLGNVSDIWLTAAPPHHPDHTCRVNRLGFPMTSKWQHWTVEGQVSPLLYLMDATTMGFARAEFASKPQGAC